MRPTPLLLVALLAAPACSSNDTDHADADAHTPAAQVEGRLKVETASFPAWYLVKRIGGELVQLDNVLPVGEDPPFWQPPAEVVTKLQQADLVVLNGANFEAFAGQVALPASRVVDSAHDLKLITIKGKTHSHGKSGPHSHAGTDPHTWGDPEQFVVQATAVANALAHRDKANAEAYRANADKLKGELTQFANLYAGSLKPLAGVPLSSSHPAFNYLARRYGLQLKSFGFDPEEPPSAEQLAKWKAWSDETGGKLLLWEAEPTAEVKAAFPKDTDHRYIDPLEQPPKGGEYDYIKQAMENHERFSVLAKKYGATP